MGAVRWGPGKQEKGEERGGGEERGLEAQFKREEVGGGVANGLKAQPPETGVARVFKCANVSGAVGSRRAK